MDTPKYGETLVSRFAYIEVISPSQSELIRLH